MISSQTIKRAILSIVLLSIVIASVLLFLFFTKEKKETYNIDFKMNSSLVSENPMQTAANFIKFNGTMGDLSEINQDVLNSGKLESNSERRKKAYDTVKSVIIKDSPLLSSRTEETIKLDNVEFYTFYETSNIEVSRPTNETKITINHANTGPANYDKVDVKVSFTSSKHTFMWPTDAINEGVIQEYKTTEDFSDILVTLVKKDNLWYVYDMPDSESVLNVRMSTWQGLGKDDVTTENELVNEYVFEGSEG